MRIEAVRRLFPKCWFNESTTEAGLEALGYYHEKKDEQRDVGLGPSHDWSSHAADAFGLMAIAYEEPSRLAGMHARSFIRRLGLCEGDNHVAIRCERKRKAYAGAFQCSFG